MDIDFIALANLYEAVYSRYGDDLTFSTDGEAVPREEINAVLGKHGFVLNEEKFKIQRKGRSQYVTGLTVSDSHQPHVPRSIKRSLRLETHFIFKYGAESHLRHHVERKTKPRLIKSPTEQTLGGWMYYVNGIDKKFMKGLERHLTLVLQRKKTKNQSTQ
jgi:hypothetical protein